MRETALPTSVRAGTVAGVSLPAIPQWLDPWCRRHLRSHVRSLIFGAGVMSDVIGVRLADGRAVVVKSRPSQGGRAAACVDIQRRLAPAGLPCALPLTDGITEGDLTAHAEEWRPGGTMRTDSGIQHAAQSAQALARVMAVTMPLTELLPRLLPNPLWVQWDNHEPGGWPRQDVIDAQQARRKIVLPEWLEEVRQAAVARIARASLPLVVGHADWEAQNLRWDGETVHTVHDWDSLAVLSESALVGAACGSFASADVPTLAPLESSVAFLEAYQEATGRRLSGEEREVAWAASLYPAAWNARGEILFDHDLVAARALADQAPERLRLAGV